MVNQQYFSKLRSLSPSLQQFYLVSSVRKKVLPHACPLPWGRRLSGPEAGPQATPSAAAFTQTQATRARVIDRGELCFFLRLRHHQL